MSEKHPLEVLSELTQAMQVHVAAAADMSNQDAADYDEVMDANERQAALILELQNTIAEKDAKIQEYGKVICIAGDRAEADVLEIQLLKAKVNELTVADAPRLVKQNKGYKKTIEESKANLAAVNKRNNELKAELKTLKSITTLEGTAPFYRDPVSGNTIRLVPNTRIPEGNAMNGVAKSPVVEFYHNDRGISRRGFIGKDGEVKWASASNSAPTASESLATKDFIIRYCKMNKIKIG